MCPFAGRFVLLGFPVNVKAFLIGNTAGLIFVLF